MPHPSGRSDVTRKQIFALTVLSAAVFMVAIDGTVLSIAVPALKADLDPTYTQVLWIGDVYSFVLAGVLVTMGNVGDRIGRKRLLILAATGFGAMSVAAAVAPSAEWLIVARALQGLAGAGLMPPTLALIRTVFTDQHERTRAIGLWSAAGAAGASIGPTVAGALVEHFYWGSVFLINVPVVLFIVIVGSLVLPESRGDSQQVIDPASVVLSTAGILGVVYGITELADRGLDSPTSALALLLGLGLLALFSRRQRHLPVPLVDFRLFSNPGFAGAVSAQFLVVLAATGALFFLSIYLQTVVGYSPLQAGLALIPVSLVSMVVAPNTGRLLRRFGPRWVLLAGLMASALGLVGIGLLEPYGYWALVVPLVLLGFSFGSVLTTAAELVLLSAPPERAGAAVGVSETSFELGGAVGIALLGSMITLVYHRIATTPDLFSDTAAYATAITVTTLVAGALVAIAAVLTTRRVPRTRTDQVPEAT